MFSSSQNPGWTPKPSAADGMSKPDEICELCLVKAGLTSFFIMGGLAMAVYCYFAAPVKLGRWSRHGPFWDFLVLGCVQYWCIERAIWQFRRVLNLIDQLEVPRLDLHEFPPGTESRHMLLLNKNQETLCNGINNTLNCLLAMMRLNRKPGDFVILDKYWRLEKAFELWDDAAHNQRVAMFVAIRSICAMAEGARRDELVRQWLRTFYSSPPELTNTVFEPDSFRPKGKIRFKRISAFTDQVRALVDGKSSNTGGGTWLEEVRKGVEALDSHITLDCSTAGYLRGRNSLYKIPDFTYVHIRHCQIDQMLGTILHRPDIWRSWSAHRNLRLLQAGYHYLLERCKTVGDIPGGLVRTHEWQCTEGYFRTLSREARAHTDVAVEQDERRSYDALFGEHRDAFLLQWRKSLYRLKEDTCAMGEDAQERSRQQSLAKIWYNELEALDALYTLEKLPGPDVELLARLKKATLADDMQVIIIMREYSCQEWEEEKVSKMLELEKTKEGLTQEEQKSAKMAELEKTSEVQGSEVALDVV